METQEYKDLLLKYITGKIDESGSSTQEMVLLDREELPINIKDNITTRLIEERSATDVIILGKIYASQFENFIIYGNYDVSSNTYGYVCIVNRNWEIVSLITQFVSGTLIYPIISIRQSETGQFYGLTFGTNGTDRDYRIALFNNILSSGIVDGNYQVVLRQTYIIPNSSDYAATLYRQNRIIKSLDSATYYVVLHTQVGLKTTIIRFKIDIAEGNTWETFTINDLVDSVQFDVYLDKSSGDEKFYLYGVDVTGGTPSTFRAYELSETLSEIKTIDFAGDVGLLTTQVFVINKDNVYISASETPYTNVYKVNGDTLQNIHSFTWASTNVSYLYFEKLGEIILYKEKNAGLTSSTIEVGLMVNDTLTTYDTETTDDVNNYLYDYNDFYAFIQYNLLSIYIPYTSTTNGTYKLVADYNPNNYNGIQYENINALLPIKSRIINTSYKYVFARNLYNKYVRNNVSVSTLEIPNTLLNDEELFYVGILGATDYTLFSNAPTLQDDPITKNVYETLDINFYNTITMLDDNNDKGAANLDGATRINQSVSAILDYNNTKATKARVNYDDGTSNVITIDPTTQITITDNYAEYQFIIYIPAGKTATSLDIISYDETTTYATMTGTFIEGAFNQINQTVTIY